MKLVHFAVAAIAIASPAHAATIGVNGTHATVANAAAGPLQCVLSTLAGQGYPVRFIRGFGRGSVRGSLHPAGMALDVNQVSRGVTVPRMPSNEISIAEHCGAVSGAVWADNDSGHFQIGGWRGHGHGHRNRHHHHRIR